jgi:WD40 repeat protein
VYIYIYIYIYICIYKVLSFVNINFYLLSFNCYPCHILLHVCTRITWYVLYGTVKGVNFFGPKSEYVVSGSDCGNIFIWDKNTEAIVQWMEGDQQGVVCIRALLLNLYLFFYDLRE